MRRLYLLISRSGLLSALILAMGCQQEPVSRGGVPSPGSAAATKTISAAESDSAASPATADEIIELIESGQYKSQTGDGAGADADYRQAGERAAHLLERRSELTRRERRVAAVASYLQARTLARGSEPERALPVIERAFAAGFEDLERLDQDAGLATVRALPKFRDVRVALEQRLDAETRQDVQQRLRDFDPYPLEFRLRNLEGAEVASTEYRGKIMVLAFWGTWCVKCQEEVPALNRIQTTFAERGVQVIGLSYEEAEDHAAAVARIRKFQESKPIEYLCLLGDEAARDQVRPPEDAPPEWIFPVTLILDPQGQVRLHFSGEVSYRRLAAAVEALLEGEQG